MHDLTTKADLIMSNVKKYLRKPSCKNLEADMKVIEFMMK
jgi:hypothetical protein